MIFFIKFSDIFVFRIGNGRNFKYGKCENFQYCCDKSEEILLVLAKKALIVNGHNVHSAVLISCSELVWDVLCKRTVKNLLTVYNANITGYFGKYFSSIRCSFKKIFYYNMRMLKLHNTYFILACFYFFLFNCVCMVLCPFSPV